MDSFRETYRCEPSDFGFDAKSELLKEFRRDENVIDRGGKRKICICCQVGNAKLWVYMAERMLKYRDDKDIDIYIAYVDPMLYEIALDMFPNAYLIPVANIGMDIGIFLKTLEYIYKEGNSYDYLCKIHTKSSEGWRNVMFDHTIDRLREHQERMDRDSGINMIGVDPCKYDFLNLNYVLDYVRKYGITHRFPAGYERLIDKDNKQIKHLAFRKSLIRKTKYRFVSGTVFFCRFNIFESHRELIKAYKDLSEGYSRDVEFQKPEHALERVFGIMAGENGLFG